MTVLFENKLHIFICLCKKKTQSINPTDARGNTVLAVFWQKMSSVVWISVTGRMSYLEARGDATNRRFNIGKFFNRHKGFDRLNTEDSDHELEHLESDSEVDEFTATGTQRAWGTTDILTQWQCILSQSPNHSDDVFWYNHLETVLVHPVTTTLPQWQCILPQPPYHSDNVSYHSGYVSITMVLWHWITKGTSICYICNVITIHYRWDIWWEITLLKYSSQNVYSYSLARIFVS